jgi:hypothetical protein
VAAVRSSTTFDLWLKMLSNAGRRNPKVLPMYGKYKQNRRKC